MATLTRTARQIIEGALRALKVHGYGQDLDPEQANDAFRTLNELLAMLSIDGLAIPFITQESFTLSVGAASYSIGSGATWNTDRPKDVAAAFIRDGSGNDYPLTPMSRARWLLLPDKDASARPTSFYYHDTYPNGTVYFNSAPAAADTAYLDLEKPIGEVASLDTTVVLPGEYALYLKHRLAIELAPEYDVADTDMKIILGLANKYENEIARRNMPFVTVDTDPAILGSKNRSTYNIESDT